MTLVQLIGLFLLLHDRKDVPKLDRVHHWQIGVVFMVFGGGGK